MSDEQYRRIEAEISSDDSPVGIDARKTHVLILSKLENIENRLTRLEEAMAAQGDPAAAQSSKNG